MKKFGMVLIGMIVCAGCYDGEHSSVGDSVDRCSEIINSSISEIEVSGFVAHSWQDVNAAITNIAEKSIRMNCLSNWLERLLAADLSKICDSRTYYLSLEELSLHKDAIGYCFKTETNRCSSEYEVGILWFEWMRNEMNRLVKYKDTKAQPSALGQRGLDMRMAYEYTVGKFDMFIRVFERYFILDVDEGLLSSGEVQRVRNMFIEHIGRPMRTREQLGMRQNAAKKPDASLNDEHGEFQPAERERSANEYKRVAGEAIKELCQ